MWGLPQVLFTFLRWNAGTRGLSVSQDSLIIHLQAVHRFICAKVLITIPLHRPSKVSLPLQWPFVSPCAAFLKTENSRVSERYPAAQGHIWVQTGGFWKPWMCLNFITRVQSKWRSQSLQNKCKTLLSSLQPPPSVPAQDTPAYKKAPGTSRRVSWGRHLGDSPTERVSPWKWCQQQSVVVERLSVLMPVKMLEVGGVFRVMNRQAVMDRVDEPCTVLICGIKQSSPRALLCKLNGVEWCRPAECSLCLAPSPCMG